MSFGGSRAQDVPLRLDVLFPGNTSRAWFLGWKPLDDYPTTKRIKHADDVPRFGLLERVVRPTLTFAGHQSCGAGFALPALGMSALRGACTEGAQPGRRIEETPCERCES
jgi:hypothetical protein